MPEIPSVYFRPFATLCKSAEYILSVLFFAPKRNIVIVTVPGKIISFSVILLLEKVRSSDSHQNAVIQNCKENRSYYYSNGQGVQFSKKFQFEHIEPGIYSENRILKVEFCGMGELKEVHPHISC